LFEPTGGRRGSPAPAKTTKGDEKMNLHEIEKTLEEKFERVSIRRVVGDLFMVFDDPGHAFILVEELSQILEEVEPKGRDLYDDYEEFWNEIGKKGNLRYFGDLRITITIVSDGEGRPGTIQPSRQKRN
jgi:hypothetical protein